MLGGGVNWTCRVYMVEEVGIIRNVMSDLASGSADDSIEVGRSLHEQVDPARSGTASRSEV